MGIFLANQKPTSARFSAIANCDGICNALSAGTNNTTSFANVASTSSFSFTKVRDDTKLLVDLDMTLYVTVASTTVRLAVNVNSVDYDLAHLYFNEGSSHKQLSGGKPLPGISAGTYTIQARWRRVGGTGVLTTDADDWLSLIATEVQ